MAAHPVQSVSFDPTRLGSTAVGSRVMIRLAAPRLPPRYGLVMNPLATAIWLLSLSTTAGIVEKTRWQTGSAYGVGVLLCLGGISLLSSVWLNRRSADGAFSSRTRLAVALLVAWCAVTVLRIDWLNWQWGIRIAWGGPYFAWAWVIPLSMLVGAEIESWRRTLSAIIHLGVLGGVVLVGGRLFSSLLSDMAFMRACPFTLLFYHYLPRRAKPIVLLGTLVTLLGTIRSATRNEVFATGLLILFAGFIQFFRQSAWRARTRAYIVLAFLFISAVIGYVASLDQIPFAGDAVNGGINRFKNKFARNTRVTVTGDTLYKEFLQDMYGVDLIIGRGCMGFYEMSYASPGHGVETTERRYVECGYLQVILHGGVVMLTLILALAIPAVYLGLFRSRNWLARGCALIVLANLLEMVPFGLPRADVRYVLFWLAIGACLTWRIRGMSEANITRGLALR